MNCEWQVSVQQKDSFKWETIWLYYIEPRITKPFPVPRVKEKKEEDYDDSGAPNGKFWKKT